MIEMRAMRRAPDVAPERKDFLRDFFSCDMVDLRMSVDWLRLSMMVSLAAMIELRAEIWWRFKEFKEFKEFKDALRRDIWEVKRVFSEWRWAWSRKMRQVARSWDGVMRKEASGGEVLSMEGDANDRSRWESMGGEAGDGRRRGAIGEALTIEGGGLDVVFEKRIE